MKGPVTCTQIKCGRYYLVVADGKLRKWIPLTTVKEGMPAFLRALADKRDVGASAYLMGNLVADWERKVMPAHAPHTRTMDQHYNALIAETFAAFRPAEVTPPDVVGLLELLQSTPKTHNMVRSQISELMRFAAECGHRPPGTNPVTELRTMRTPPRSRYITDSELRRIKIAAIRGADGVDTRSGPMLCALVDMAYLTGQRIGDLLTMEWAQITQDGVAFKPNKTSKSTGARLLVAWSPRLHNVVARLRALRAEREAHTTRVFVTQEGQPYTYSGATSAWKRAVRRSGVKGLTFNDLRAKAITDTDTSQGRAAANAKGAHSTEGQTMDYIRHKTARKTGATK
jgi:integrase